MAEGLLPPEVLRNVNEVNGLLKKVQEKLNVVLPLYNRESLAKLSPVDRASTYLTLSKTATVLFSVYLRTNGIAAEDHPLKTELARCDLYKDKVQRAVDTNTGPKRPFSNVDIKAANRFIEHAIPDLSGEQKRRLKELGQTGPARSQQQRGATSLATSFATPKKRTSGLTLAEEAAAFLAEASRELTGKKVGEEPTEEREREEPIVNRDSETDHEND